MATVIDTLLVVLGLDAKPFSDGSKQVGQDLDKTRKATDKTAADMELSGKRAAQFFVELRNQALLAASVITGGVGLKEFVQQTIAGERAVGNLAKTLNMGIEELSTWEGVAKYAGASAADIDSAFTSITKSVQGLLTQGLQDNLTQFLQKFHIPFETTDSNGIRHMRDVAEIYKDIADVLNKNPESALSLGGFAGFSGNGLAMLMMGRQELEKLVTTYGELVKIQDKDKESSTELDNAWKRLIDTSQHLGRQALTMWGPGVAAQINKSVDIWSGAKPTPQGDFVGMLTAEFLGMLGNDEAKHAFLMNQFGFDDGWRPGDLSRPSGAARQDIKPIGTRGITTWSGALPSWYHGATPSGYAAPGVQLGVLQDELASATSSEDRARIMREIERAGAYGYAGSVMDHVNEGGKVASNGNQTTVSIQNQTINTQAKDSDAIARDFARSLTDIVGQSNSAFAR